MKSRLIGFAITTNAQELCPCEMENKADALLAVAQLYNTQEYTNSDVESGDGWAVVAAIVGGLSESLTEGSQYALRIRFQDGRTGWVKVPSCEMSLNYTYEILRNPRSEVLSVKIITASTYNVWHPSCRNVVYDTSDLNTLRTAINE